MMLLHLKLLLPFLATPLCYAFSESTCRLCPSGSVMGRPDKLIVGTEQFSSCGAIETLLANVPTGACETALRELNSSPIDFREYCECTDYNDGPNFCSLCGNDEFINSNESQPLLGGYSCGQYIDLASAAQTLEYCGTLRMGQHVCCEEAKHTTDVCTVCQNGADMLMPDRRVVLLRDNITCQDYERELEVFAQHPYCDGLPGFDFASFCACEGVNPPGTCEFCSVDEMSDPSLEVYIDGLDVWLTCEEVALATAHTSDDRLCNLLNQHSYKCCGVEAQVKPTHCRVCSSDAQMMLPDRELIAHYDQTGRSLTCEAFDRYLANESMEVCRVILDEEAIALPSFCGCSDAPSFPNVCKPLCSGGQEIIDPNAEVLLNGVNVTCGQADLLNLYFFDEGLCAENFPILEESCCGYPFSSSNAVRAWVSVNNISEHDTQDVEAGNSETQMNVAGGSSLASKFIATDASASSDVKLNAANAESGGVALSSSTLLLWIFQAGTLGILLR